MNHKVLFSWRLLPRFYLPLLLVLCSVLAWRPLEGGFDFWAHAAVGKWIWTHGQPPVETLFIWSEPHTPWVAHSWLSELFFFAMISQIGPPGVVLFTLLMSGLVFALLWQLWKRNAPVNSCVPLLFALTIWVSAPRFQPRQELISALFLMLLFCFLIALQKGRFDEWLSGKRALKNPKMWMLLFSIFLLFAFWVNLHALVAIGLLILFLSILGEGVQLLFEKRIVAIADQNSADEMGKKRFLFLLLTGVLCALATVFNPYGIGYWSAAQHLKSGSQAEYIQEWKALWSSPVMWEYLLAEIFLFALAVVAWLSNPQRRWAELLWTLLMALLLLRSRRMLWLTALVFVVVLALNAHALARWEFWKRWRKMTGGDQNEALPTGLRVVARSGTILVLLVWIVTTFLHLVENGRIRKGVFVRNVPAGAADFILRTPEAKRIFNDYEDGSYLQWRLNGEPPERISAAGRQPLYIDMLNAYPDSLLFEYFDILAARTPGLQKLAEREIDLIVLGDHQWKKPLATYLEDNPELWQLVWSDKESKVWMKTQR